MNLSKAIKVFGILYILISLFNLGVVIMYVITDNIIIAIPMTICWIILTTIFIIFILNQPPIFRFLGKYDTITRPQLPYKRPLTEDEMIKLRTHYPEFGWTTHVDNRGHILLNGGMDNNAIHYTTPEHLAKY